jgi:hypothetical protein
MSYSPLATVITTVLASSLFYAPLLQYAYFQTSAKNVEQLWTDSDHDLKIRFVYEPKIPIVDKPTELKFTVQWIKMTTGPCNKHY